MSNTFRDLRYFRAIVEHNSMREAGDAVGISQPALSKCLRRLEQIYGGPLLERNGNGARPTAIGEIVYRNSEDILFRIDETVRQVRGVSAGSQGDVRFGAGPYAAEAGAKQALAAFMREHPQSCAEMTIAPWNELSKLLYREHLDFFIADVGDTMLTGEFDVTEVAGPTTCWYCRPDHPLAATSKIPPRSLTEYPIAGPIVPTRAGKYLMDVKRVGAGPNQVAPDRPLSVICDDWGMLKYFAQHSDCVAIGPSGAFRDELANGALVQLDVDHPNFVVRLAAVRIKAKPISPLAETFLNLFAEHLRR